MKTLTKYQCERCGTKYNNAEDARICEEFAVDLVAQPGDIVITGYPGYEHRFGWFNGDESWVADHDEKNKLYSFYFVVSAITYQPECHHEEGRCVDNNPLYHCFTRAVRTSGNDANKCNWINKAGWTRTRGHYPLRKVIPLVRPAGADEFIGCTTKVLL